MDDLRYNPDIQGKMVDKYPALKSRFPNDEVSDKLLRFAILFADPISPLAEERDIEIRKKDILRYMKEPGTTWYKEVKDDTENWNEILFNFFVLINNFQYEAWLSLKISFHKLSAELRGVMDQKDRVSAGAGLIKMAEEIKQLEAKIFPDEYTKRAIVNKVSMTGHAEKYAKTL